MQAKDDIFQPFSNSHKPCKSLETKAGKLIFHLPILALCLLASILQASATIRYVKQDATGTGASWNNASPDIQAMINASSSGDEIWVAVGTYKPNRRANATATITLKNRDNAFVLKNGVKVYGGFNGDEAFLADRHLNLIENPSYLSGDFNGDDYGRYQYYEENAKHVIVSSGNTAATLLDGFVISGGNANSTNISVNTYTIYGTFGGGLVITNSAASIANCIINYNKATSGGGMGVFYATAAIYNCDISFNDASSNGGGVCNMGGTADSSKPVFTNCTVTFNCKIGGAQARGAGFFNHYAAPVITNCKIIDNETFDIGSAIYSEYSSPIVTNCTICGNVSQRGAAIENAFNSKIIVRNSLLFFNRNSDYTSGTSINEGMVSRNSSQEVAYSYVQGLNAATNGNLNASTTDPLTVGYLGENVDDYSLQPCSPLVNRGNSDFYSANKTPNLSSIVTDLVGNDRFYGTIDIGAYETLPVTVSPNNGRVYVTPNGCGDGSSWANATAYVQAAIDGVGTTEVWVAGGTYLPTIKAGNGTSQRNKSFVLKNNVAVYGGFVGTETALYDRNLTTSNTSLLSGDLYSNDGAGLVGNSENSFHVVISSGDVGSAILNGFTIKGGNTSGYNIQTVNGYDFHFFGGGVACSHSSPTLSNLVVKENYGLYGGGLGGQVASPTVASTIISGNASGFGGAMYNSSYSSPSLINVLISGNTAVSNGGAVFTEYSSSPRFTNATISGNKTDDEIGVSLYLNGGDLKFLNSILWDDGRIFTEGAQLELKYSLVKGLTGTENNNIGSTDPMFEQAMPGGLNSGGDYRLKMCSPAINAGQYLNNGLPALEGGLRLQGTAIDMGAYEFSTNGGNPGGGGLLASNADVAVTDISGNQTNELTATNAVCHSVAAILASGSHPVSGGVSAKVFVDDTVQSYPYAGKTIPYLQRHYEINPDNEAATATARLTLYYTQAEFDAFNLLLDISDISLPKNPTDAIGKYLMRIYQYHGRSSDGTGSPNSYSGGGTLIDPDDDKIVWNADLQRWEITFDINGFSGFFLGVDPLVILPVKLFSFTGQIIGDEKAADLQWQVASQQGIKQYVVEKSLDGNSFQIIGTVEANQLTSATYHYNVLLPSASSLLTIYYRLKIIDLDGKISYSQIVRLNLQVLTAGKVTLYPNPIGKDTQLQISISNGVLRQYKLITATGQVLLQKDGLHVVGTTGLQLPLGLAVGVYYLQLHTDKGVRNERVVVK